MRIKIIGSMGDDVGITGMVREYKRKYPGEVLRLFNCPRPEIWRHNPYLGWGSTFSDRIINFWSYDPKHVGSRVDHYCGLAGLAREDIVDELPELYFTQEEIDWRPEDLELGPDCIAIDPGAGWWTRIWPEEKFHFLSAALRDMGFRVFQVGSKRKRDLEGAVDLTSRKFNIRQTALVLAQCGLYVGNDSGLYHLAAAVGTPHVTVYGVSRAAAGPYPTTIPVFPRSECATSCYMTCMKKTPAMPAPYNFCMAEISVDQVLEACRQALAERRGVGRLHASVDVLAGLPLEAGVAQLGDRAAAAARLVELVRARRPGYMVETGVFGTWQTGGSTPILAQLAEDAGGALYSIDNDRMAIYRAAGAVGRQLAKRIHFTHGDSVRELHQVAAAGRKVDVVHLDTVDGGGLISAARQMGELQVIYPALSDRAVVVLGASDAAGRMPAEAWLSERGWKCEARAIASVWARN